MHPSKLSEPVAKFYWGLHGTSRSHNIEGTSLHQAARLSSRASILVLVCKKDYMRKKVDPKR